MEKSKRITFLGINASYSHSMLSYGYLRAFTEEKLPEWEWSLVEKTINDDELKIVDDLLGTEPEAVVMTCYLFNIDFSLEIIRKVKLSHPEINFFLGGPEFLGDNREFLVNNPEVTALFRGDETSFYQVLEKEGGRESWQRIPGICYLEKGHYKDNGSSVFEKDLDELPSPFQKGYFQESKPFVHFETSRGCNGKCTFCTSSLCDGVKTSSLERAFQDLKCIQEKGVREVRLIDRTFNESEKRTIALLEMFKKHFSDIRFHIEITPSMLTEKQIKLINSFNPDKLHIEIGIQTCNEDVLKKIKRYGSSRKSIQGLKNICRGTKIPVHTDLIFGLPGQKFQDVIEDVMQLIELNPDEIQLENLKLLPGTPLREPENGLLWNQNPPYQLIKSTTFSEEQLKKLSILSLLLDSYYNTVWLKRLFSFMCKTHTDFVDTFLKNYISQAGNHGKLSIQKRFEILEPFTETEDLGSSLYKFSWLAAGLPRKRFGLKTALQRPAYKTENILWQNRKQLPSKRNITVSFPFNIAALWLDSDNDIKHRTTTYIFNIAYGNVISSISEITI